MIGMASISSCFLLFCVTLRSNSNRMTFKIPNNICEVTSLEVWFTLKFKTEKKKKFKTA